MSRPTPADLERERVVARQKAESEAGRREQIRESTKMTDDERAAFIRSFVAERAIETYPVRDEDLRDENAFEPTGPSLQMRVSRQVARAAALHGFELPVAETTVAQWILTSRDDEYGIDVDHLPAGACTPDRVLAHVESLQLGLPETLAGSIARRTFLELVNRLIQAKVASPTEESSDEDDKEPSMCMDCGATLVSGSCPSCGG